MSAQVNAQAGLVEAIRARADKGREPIRRDACQDGQLTMKARGILAYLVSKPDKWRTSAAAIAEDCAKDGREAIATGLQELEDAGYLARRRLRKPDGTWAWAWIYSDDPAEVDQVLTEMFPDGAPPEMRRGRARAPKLQVKPINGIPVPGDTNAQVAPINGLSVDGESAHGKPVDIEIQERDLPPQPPAGRGEPESPPEELTAPGERCEHGRTSCRTCGTSPRAQAWAERDAAEAEAALKAAAVKACGMCDVDGQRWAREGGGRCDHVTAPAEYHAEQRRLAEAADEVRTRAEACRAPIAVRGRAEARRLFRPKPKKNPAPAQRSLLDAPDGVSDRDAASIGV